MIKVLKGRLLYLQMLAFLGTLTLTHGAYAQIPAEWEDQDVKVNSCILLFQKVVQSISGVNEPSTRHLARAAFYYRSIGEGPFNRTQTKSVYSVKFTFTTPTLFNLTHDLTYKIIGKNNRRVVRISLDEGFLGQKVLSVSYPLAETNLKFIQDDLDPEIKDTAFIEELTERALVELRIKRLKPLEMYLNSVLKSGKSGIQSISHQVATDNLQTPYLTLSYIEESALYAYFGLGNEALVIFLKMQKDNKTFYKKMIYSYSDFNSRATELTQDHQSARALKGIGYPFDPYSFRFFDLWREGKISNANEIPDWVPR